MNQINCAGEQKSGGEARLDGKALLIQEAVKPGGVIEIKPSTCDDEGQDESAKERKQNSDRPAPDESSVEKLAHSIYGIGVNLPESGNQSGSQNSNCVQQHP